MWNLATSAAAATAQLRLFLLKRKELCMETGVKLVLRLLPVNSSFLEP